MASTFGALVLAGCPSPMMPPPPEEPMIAAPETPRIPWLAAGTPDVEAPRIPWRTDESACPAGWGWIEVAPGLNGCDPYPAGRIEDCGPTGAHFPGEAGCRDLDSGDTEWPSDLPATNVLYVREGAMGGDGTRALPFATLPEALAVATEGATIALGPGRYDTGQGAERTDLGVGVFDTLSKVLVDGVRIRGTSVARTTLFSSRPAPPMASDVGMLTVQASDVEISNLRFESPHPAVHAIGGSIVVSRVVLDGTFFGLFCSEGCAAVFEDVIARNTTGQAAVAAVNVENVTVRRAVLVGTGVFCLAAVGAGSSLVVEDAWVDGFQAAVGAWDGGDVQFSRLGARHPAVTALSAQVGGQITGRWLSMELGVDPGGVTASGGILNVEDLVGRGTPSDSGFVSSVTGGQATISRAVLAGRYCAIGDSTIDASDIVCVSPDFLGLGGRAGATVRVSRADISVRTGGLWAETGAQVEATDVLIHDVAGSAAYADGASLSLERVRIERASIGINAFNEGHVTASNVSMQDLVIVNADRGAAGIGAGRASSVTASRVLINGVEGYGVLAAEMGDLDLTDLVLRDVRGPPGRSAGLLVAGDAHAAFRRVEIDGSAEQGARLLGPAEIEDLSVHDVSASVDGEQGFGVVVGTSVGGIAPTVTAARVSVRDTDAIGIFVAGGEPGATPGRLSLTLSDVRVERVRMPALGGGGLVAQGEADVSLAGFVMRDTANVGVASSMGARLVLSNGLVVSADVCTSSDAPLDLTTVQTDQCGPSAITPAP